MQNPASKRTYRILAVNDSRDFCECCGRQGLKRVVWVADEETGEHHHFGTTCAMAPAKGFDKAAVKTAIRAFENLQGRAWAQAHAKYRAGGHGYHWTAFGVSAKANRPEILQGLFEAAWAGVSAAAEGR